MGGSAIIETRGLHCHYRTLTGKRIHAVRGLDLTVREGEVVGFIGPNGAGKSTTIKTLLGFQQPTSGTAAIFGLPAGDVRARRRIGFLPEVALYYPFLTARETLRLYATLAEVPRERHEALIDGLLRQVNLTGRDREPVRGFSKGMLQRVGIAQAILGAPDLLILDEVTSGLDPVARYDVRRILLDFKARGKTVFFSSHELSEVTMLCDRVVLLDEGRLLREDTLDGLLTGLERHVLKLPASASIAALPDRVVLRSAGRGTQTFIAETDEARAEFEGQLAAAGVAVLERTREPASLEDYFVRAIGHKVT